MALRKFVELGSATSYTIDILRLRNNSGKMEFEYVFSGKTYEFSFKVPPRILSSGNTYFAEIGAFQAPWDVVDAPGAGDPFEFAGCVTLL